MINRAVFGTTRRLSNSVASLAATTLSSDARSQRVESLADASDFRFGLEQFGARIVDAMVGVVRDPLVAARDPNATPGLGLLRGITTGLTGIAFKPAIGLMDLLSSASGAIETSSRRLGIPVPDGATAGEPRRKHHHAQHVWPAPLAPSAPRPIYKPERAHVTSLLATYALNTYQRATAPTTPLMADAAAWDAASALGPLPPLSLAGERLLLATRVACASYRAHYRSDEVSYIIICHRIVLAYQNDLLVAGIPLQTLHLDDALAAPSQLRLTWSQPITNRTRTLDIHSSPRIIQAIRVHLDAAVREAAAEAAAATAHRSQVCV